MAFGRGMGGAPFQLQGMVCPVSGSNSLLDRCGIALRGGHQTKRAALCSYREQALIEPDIVGCHARGRKALLEAPAHAAAIERQQRAELAYGLLLAIDHKPGDAFV